MSGLRRRAVGSIGAALFLTLPILAAADTFTADKTVVVSPELKVSIGEGDEITLIGSRCGPFAPALQLLAGGKIDPRPMIHARYPLHDVNAAFAHAERQGVLKVLLVP